MSKKTVIIVIVLAVIALIIFIGSFFYPLPKGDDSSGTIGKAEKFRKGLYTAEDILLREDIFEDTAAVGKTLDQILTFTSFISQEKLMIDTFWVAEIKKNCSPYPGCIECENCDKAVTMLQDYSNFLANNKETIRSTIDILLVAYNGKQKDLSFDAGVKLLGFVQFIDEMIKRDSVLTTAILLVDQYITKEKITDKKRQIALSKLKQVRNKMVIDNLLFAMKTGDRKQSELVASIPFIGTVDDIKNSFGPIGAAEEIGSGVVATAPDLSYTAAVETIGVYGTGRYDVAANIITLCSAADDRVIRQEPVINSMVGIDDMGTVKNIDLGIAPTIVNIVGPEFSNMVDAAPLDVFGSAPGTVFNNEAIGVIVDPG